jgi:hypothetical protein
MVRLQLVVDESLGAVLPPQRFLVAERLFRFQRFFIFFIIQRLLQNVVFCFSVLGRMHSSHADDGTERVKNKSI